MTGDWGGGYDLGLAALGAAARVGDGRGPRRRWSARCRRRSASPTRWRCRPRCTRARLLRAAPGRAGAGGASRRRRTMPSPPALVDRLADEIVAFVRATLPRIGAGDAPVEVVLGGGLLQAPNARLRDAVGERLAALDPCLRPVVPADPPIVGAALMALERRAQRSRRPTASARPSRPAVSGAQRRQPSAPNRATMSDSARGAESDNPVRLPRRVRDGLGTPARVRRGSGRRCRAQRECGSRRGAAMSDSARGAESDIRGAPSATGP